MADFKLTGQRELERKLKIAASRAPAATSRALYKEAQKIMTESKRNYVPVDLGTLRSSGFVLGVRRVGKSFEVTLGFGGAASPYALAVHEVHSEYDPPSWRNTDVNFKLTGRGRKYLEIPLRMAIRGMDARIAQEISKSMGIEWIT